MPLLQFETGGQSGGMRGGDYCVTDRYEHYVLTAKMFALAAYRLMKDGAALAKKIKAENPPRMTPDEWRTMKAGLSTVRSKEMQPIPWFGPTIDEPEPPKKQQ